MKNWLKSPEYSANRNLDSCVRLFRLHDAYTSVHFSEKINGFLTRKNNLTVLQALPRRSENWGNLIWFNFSPDLGKVIVPASVRGASLNNRKLIEQFQGTKRPGFDPKSIFLGRIWRIWKKSKVLTLDIQFCHLNIFNWKRKLLE